MRRTGGNHNARKSFLLDVVLDHLLTERRTHELVIARYGDVLDVLSGPAGDLFHVDHAGNVASTMTNVNADLLGHGTFSVTIDYLAPGEYTRG